MWLLKQVARFCWKTRPNLLSARGRVLLDRGRRAGRGASLLLAAWPLIFFWGCGKDPLPPAFDPEGKLARLYQNALHDGNPKTRVVSLLALEEKLREPAEKVRKARWRMIQVSQLLGSSLKAAGHPRESGQWESRWRERLVRYRKLDPEDGVLLNMQLQGLAARGRVREAWQVFMEGQQRVDLETLPALLAAGSTLASLHRLRAGAGNQQDRDWRGKLADVYGELALRVRQEKGPLDLLEKVLSDRGLVLLGLGRVEQARQVLAELKAAALPGGPYFRLESALSEQAGKSPKEGDH